MRFPIISEGVKLTSLPIDPFEGFIVSRMDGRSTIEDLADSTGATVEQVKALLGKLELLGALAWAEAAEPRATRPEPSRPTPTTGQSVMTRPTPDGASRVLYDPAELEEDVDLDDARKREILDLFYRLEELTHYELLSVEQDAEKKEIRKAYFRVSKRFHPDTLFGKNLGSYKQKMEVVFRAATEAYEVLGKKKKRSEYDSYLETVATTKRLSKGLTVPPPPMQTPPISREDGGQRQPREDRVRSERPKSGPVPKSEPEAKPEPKEPEKPISRPVAKKPQRSEAQRRKIARQLLQKRLAGASTQTRNRASVRPATPPPAPPDKAQDRSSVLKGLASSLKRVADVTGGVDRVERHLADADASEKSGDIVGAVNALRLALSLSPDRDDVQERYDQLRTRLAAELADTYERQATYEESQDKWDAAWRSWAKVLDGRPTYAKAARRAAEALMQCDGDLRQARDFAQRAVELEPKSALSRRVLGEIFIKAGMKASAKRELQQAAKLDPANDFVKNLLRELK